MMNRSVACAAAVLLLALPSRADSTLEISITDAVLMALGHNRELAVVRYEPEIVRTDTLEEQGVFDPFLIAEEIGRQQVKGEKLTGSGRITSFDTDSPVGVLGLGVFLPTGTEVSIETSSKVTDEAPGTQLVQSRAGLRISQALLRGMGTGANLARIRAARLDAQISDYELRGFTESLVGMVEQAYWDYAYHSRQVEILEQAIALAEQLYKETQERVATGAIPRAELAAGKSEAAARAKDLVDARGDAEKARLLLIQLMNPDGTDPWSRQLTLTSPLAASEDPIGSVADQIATAVDRRPDLNQARLLVARGELEVVRTRNGTLPRMDFFVTLGRSGYAESFSEAWKTREGDFNDARWGITFEFPLLNRSARADHSRAVLQRGQSEEAVSNLRQLVELDVRTAFVEVVRAREMIEAASLSRQLEEEKLQAEADKSRIGRSSAFQVARAQRDLVRSRLDEAEAIADERKALVELAKQAGSLLDRRAIAAPGSTPPSDRRDSPAPRP